MTDKPPRTDEPDRRNPTDRPASGRRVPQRKRAPIVAPTHDPERRPDGPAPGRSPKESS